MVLFSQTSLQAGGLSQRMRVSPSVGPPAGTKLAVAPRQVLSFRAGQGHGQLPADGKKTGNVCLGLLQKSISLKKLLI